MTFQQLLAAPLPAAAMIDQLRFAEQFLIWSYRFWAEHPSRPATLWPDLRTGFGLIGHALEMASGSGLVAELDAEAPPLLAGVEALVRAGVRTGASTRNWDSYGAKVEDTLGVPDWRRDLLTDPQTSGGLLIAVAPEAAEAVLSAARAAGFHHTEVVGRLSSRAAAASPAVRLV